MFMKENLFTTISVVIPEFQRQYVLAKKTKATGKPRMWTINGQSIYNAAMHHYTRASVTNYFHNYLSKYIKEQINDEMMSLIKSNVGKNLPYKLSISLDIYEIKRGKIPDVGNLWLWIKWFEDALQECNVIPDDNPDYVIESGRKTYRWVDDDTKRKLVFNINIINNHE